MSLQNAFGDSEEIKVPTEDQAEEENEELEDDEEIEENPDEVLGVGDEKEKILEA